MLCFTFITENINIPFPFEDWDAGFGNASQHFERMKACKKEIKSLIIVNFLYNCILLVPIYILGNMNTIVIFMNYLRITLDSDPSSNIVYKLFFTAIKISERHDILYETIGYLPEEQTSYEQVWIIANSSLVFVIFGTILEAILVIIYNEKVHPFKNIIIDFITAEKQGVDNVMMNDLKSSSPENIRNKQNTA